MIRIAVANRKGGVAKTTSAAHLAEVLARMGFRVLLLDLDPQFHSSKWFGYGEEYEGATLYNVLSSVIDEDDPGKQTSLQEVAVSCEDFALIPGRETLAGLENDLMNNPDGQFALASAFEGVDDEYDFCIIDCPPSLGMLTTNALVAANYVMIPLQLSQFDLDGVKMLARNIKKVQKRLNPNLRVLGVFGTIADMTNASSRVNAEMATIEGVGENVLKTNIPRATCFKDCLEPGSTLFHYGRNDKAIRRAANAYVDLTIEALTRTGYFSAEELDKMAASARLVGKSEEVAHAVAA